MGVNKALFGDNVSKYIFFSFSVYFRSRNKFENGKIPSISLISVSLKSANVHTKCIIIIFMLLVGKKGQVHCYHGFRVSLSGSSFAALAHS